MDSPAPGLMSRDAQGYWLKLETLIRVRWLAACGQLLALVVAKYVFGLHFAFGLCLGVVAVSAASNLLSSLIFPRIKRLSETEALLTLVFDTTQLAVLLFLTGGMNNPFGLLLIAPVTIAATALTLRSVLILGGIAVALASLLAFSFEPLRTVTGDPLLLPDLFRFGFWIALVIGIVFTALYSGSVAAEKQALTEALLATSMALAREQKLTDLGGVIAAAAHELGTPLATIKLVSSEMIDALDDPDLAEDARLIREQADRCRAILRSMGQAGKDDLHLRHAPLEAVVTEAAEPHAARGKAIRFELGVTEGRMPEIQRLPEIVHGLRNMVQNAVDFAATGVWVEADWSDTEIVLRVIDDGPGFPPHLLPRIGDPYLRDRRAEDPRGTARQGYEGMGLGLFIAKTLLERTGASVRFRNAPPSGPRSGALAEVRWPRQSIAADPRRALGENAPIGPKTG